MDAAEYKHIVMGLIFLKYISDSFEALHKKLVEGKGEYDVPFPFQNFTLFLLTTKPKTDINCFVFLRKKSGGF
jgi:type I restriction-modification system DNA methylase subunit